MVNIKYVFRKKASLLGFEPIDKPNNFISIMDNYFLQLYALTVSTNVWRKHVQGIFDITSGAAKMYYLFKI